MRHRQAALRPRVMFERVAVPQSRRVRADDKLSEAAMGRDAAGQWFRRGKKPGPGPWPSDQGRNERDGMDGVGARLCIPIPAYVRLAPLQLCGMNSHTISLFFPFRDRSVIRLPRSEIPELVNPGMGTV